MRPIILQNKVKWILWLARVALQTSHKEKKALLTLFWTKAKNYDVVLQFYLENSPSLQGFTSAGSLLLGTEKTD